MSGGDSIYKGGRESDVFDIQGANSAQKLYFPMYITNAVSWVRKHIMKLITFLLLLVLLGGCVDHHSASSYDLKSVELDAESILDHGFVNMDDLPTAIDKLNPNDIRISSEGLYIVLTRSFVAESGFFVPNPTAEVNTKPGSDPEIKRISGNVYSYIIKG